MYKYMQDDLYFEFNGRIVDADFVKNLPDDSFVRVHARGRGGKGGFGSMLRAIGSQIEKTTNHEMCRDLTGRRMRDVNAEKKLREWYAKANDRDREKAELYIKRRMKRQELLNNGPLPNHKFEDKKYMQQKEKIEKGLQSAMEDTLTRIILERKRQSDSDPSTSTVKKSRLLYDDYDNLDVSSSSSSDDASEPSPPPSPQATPEAEPSTAEKSPPNISEAVAKEDVVEEVVEKEVEPSVDEPKPPLEAETPVPQADVPPISDEELLTFRDAESLASSLSMDVLKSSLAARGLKCGGTQKERATRLLAVKGLSKSEYPKHLLAKAKSK